MKNWMIVGGILGGIVIVGVVAGGLFVGKALETPYVEGPLDSQRVTIKTALTRACLRQKNATRQVCVCSGEKAPRYLNDKEAAIVAGMIRNRRKSERARDLLVKASARAGFVCGMQQGVNQKR